MQLSTAEKNRLQSKYGEWAIVTGATSGIGKEIATQLAAAGLNLVLTGRRAELLYRIAMNLQETHQIKTIAEAGDLSVRSEVESLLEKTATHNIGLAVLNAGFGMSGELVDSNLDTNLNMLDVNCRAVFIMTHHFARQFKAQQRGGIILLSSMLGFQGTANTVHYAATKAYVQSMGEGLAVELKPHGVDVLCAAPGPVGTGFAERADMKMDNPMTPTTVAIPILKALGRKSTVLPGRLTKVLTYSLSTLPRSRRVRVLSKVMEGMSKN